MAETTYTEAWASFFGAGPEANHKYQNAVVQSRAKGIPFNCSGTISRYVVTPKLPRLPISLEPWLDVLKAWARISKKARSSYPMQNWALEDANIKVSGPYLPPDYSAWFASIGVDPGPEQTGKGHTCLLLIGAPAGWDPGLKECLHGAFGERIYARLDSLVMHVPRAWWDIYAYGAMEKGALYFVAPLPPPSEGAN